MNGKLFGQRLISPWLTFKAKLIIAGCLVLAALLFAKIIVMFGGLALLLGPILLIGLVLSYFILRDPELGFLLIIFFLPFERVPTLAIGGTDIKINTILGLITLLAWVLALMANSQRWKIKPNALAIPLLLFAGALVASLSGAYNFERALMVLTFILFTMALSVLAVNMVYSKEVLKKVILVLFTSALITGRKGQDPAAAAGKIDSDQAKS